MAVPIGSTPSSEQHDSPRRAGYPAAGAKQIELRAVQALSCSADRSGSGPATCSGPDRTANAWRRPHEAVRLNRGRRWKRSCGRPAPFAPRHRSADSPRAEGQLRGSDFGRLVPQMPCADSPQERAKDTGIVVGLHAVVTLLANGKVRSI